LIIDSIGRIGYDEINRSSGYPLEELQGIPEIDSTIHVDLALYPVRLA
jgi:hypothetical protein